MSMFRKLGLVDMFIPDLLFVELGTSFALEVARPAELLPGRSHIREIVVVNLTHACVNSGVNSSNCFRPTKCV